MWGWWEKITTPAHLPTPEGPYIPGGVDVMTEYSPSGTFIRVYYPSQSKAKNGISGQSDQALSRGGIKWLPEYRYFEGCAKLMGLWRIFVWAGYSIIAGMNASIPVSWGSRLRLGKNENEQESQKIKHPIVIISHGMAGTRYSHSALGLELASNGFVVAAVEHRDGSASGTFYFASQKDMENGVKTWIPYKQYKFGNDAHYKARKEQVEQRSQELIKALNVLEKINSGELGDQDNLLHADYSGKEFNVSQLKGRLDFTYPAVIGYSFGGPSALLAIKKDSRFRQAVGLDVWMFPIKEEVEETGKAIAPNPYSAEPNCKMYFINSQTFHNAINVKTLNKLLSAMKGNSSEAKGPEVVTIRGTTHEHLCDWPLLLGSWLDHFLPGKLIPIHGHQILSNLVLQFLSEPYSSTPNLGLAPKLKLICDEFVHSQLHHLSGELIYGGTKNKNN